MSVIVGKKKSHNPLKARKIKHFICFISFNLSNLTKNITD